MFCLARYIVSLSMLALLSACASAPHTATTIERIGPEELAKLTPTPTPNLSETDLISLSKSGVSAEDIIERIQSTHSTYALSTADIVRLHQAGVDTKVLDHIQTSRERRQQEAIADEFNQREKQHQEQERKLKRLLLSQPPFFGPFYDPFYGPYWPGRFGPLYRRGFYW